MVGILSLTLLAAVRADINTHPANPGTGHLVLEPHAIIVTALDIETEFPWFLWIEGAAGEGLGRTGFNALPAIAASIRHGAPRFQRGIGKDGDPTNTGAHFRGDQEATRADPAESRKPGCHLMRKKT